MSYILEALKKSQAERQLGSAPTLHAMPVGAARGRCRRGAPPPAVDCAGAVALAVAALAALAWRLQCAGCQAAQRRLPWCAAPAPRRAPCRRRSPAPVVAAPPLAVRAAVVARAAEAGGRACRAGAGASRRSRRRAAAPAALAEEEQLPTLRELPEAIQRAVPPLAFGGYMYSKNPADRLLLIDKTLRHEGEEVAPGLVLEKLLPKAAVMNYKGYRYRVPY